MLGLLWAELHLAEHVEHDAGVECAAAGPHRKPVESRKPHRRRDAPSIFECAEACPASEMSYDDPPLVELRRIGGQHRSNVRVGKTVESVTAHPPIGHFARKCEQLRQFRLMPMECGVEASNLREVRRLPL